MIGAQSGPERVKMGVDRGGGLCQHPGTCGSDWLFQFAALGWRLKAHIRWFSQGLLPVGCVLSECMNDLEVRKTCFPFRSH